MNEHEMSMQDGSVDGCLINDIVRITEGFTTANMKMRLNKTVMLCCSSVDEDLSNTKTRKQLSHILAPLLARLIHTYIVVLFVANTESRESCIFSLHLSSSVTIDM